MSDICPCKECVPPKRKCGCHDKGNCTEYTEWVARQSNKKLMKRKQQQCERLVEEYHCRMVEKIKRIRSKYQ